MIALLRTALFSAFLGPLIIIAVPEAALNSPAAPHGRESTGPERRANDCYLKRSRGRVVVGNAKVEIGLDSTTGAIMRLLNKTTKTEYVGGSSGPAFELTYATYSLHGAPPNDLWSAGYGSLIGTNGQRVTQFHFNKTDSGATLDAVYDRMYDEGRPIQLKVHYTIDLRVNDEETRWKIAIDNRDKGTVKEVYFPIISGLSRFEKLIMPNHGGQLLRDPIAKLNAETPFVSLEYPSRASMQWFEYYGKDAGLYLACYDKDMGYKRMCFGRMTGGRQASTWFVEYPFVVAGASWVGPEAAIGIHAGDWHWGADRYRAWLESWVSKPQPAKRVEGMIFDDGEQMIKGPDEKTLCSYRDLISRNRAMLGLPGGRGLMLVGWMYNGHDTYYPEYNAIPDLGGGKALTDVIDSIHALGLRVNAYMNGRLCNIETDTYKTHGKHWAVLGMAPGLGVGSVEFFELQEGWNKYWERAGRGEGWFSVMCPSAKGWQDHLVGQVTHMLRDYHFDGIFFDQPGSYYAELCYNRYHGHSTPATAWGPGQLELIRRIHSEGRKINPEFAMWIEGMNDVYGQFLDYQTDKNPVWEPMRLHPDAETFVEMWRYTVPWYITANSTGAYTFVPSKDTVYGSYYHFVMGIRIMGERVAGPVTEKVEKLWRKGGDFFFSGRFMDDVGLSVLTPDVLAKAYLGGKGVAVPLWNTSDRALTCDLTLDLRRIRAAEGGKIEVISLETEKPVRYSVHGDRIDTKVQIAPHDVTVVVVRPE